MAIEDEIPETLNVAQTGRTMTRDEALKLPPDEQKHLWYRADTGGARYPFWPESVNGFGSMVEQLPRCSRRFLLDLGLDDATLEAAAREVGIPVPNPSLTTIEADTQASMEQRGALYHQVMRRAMGPGWKGGP